MPVFELIIGVLLLTADPAVELAARIDHHVSNVWREEQIQPAQRADDAEFFRRVSLDLTGQIPPAADVRAFLEDARSEKRREVVERLLHSAAFARHWSTVLRADWVPQASEPLGDAFARWLESQLREGASFDQLARSILTASMRPAADNPQQAAARSFLIANDFKPENLAANTARQFVGLNLDCAQCHNHPFARWTQDQFWEFAAFFAETPTDAATAAPQITIPQTEKTVTARFPDGSEPAEQAGIDPRVQLVDWMTLPDNRYFSRNAVNRVWAYFLGSGLVEPLDDLSGAVQPSHPELLDELADAFTKSGYDLRFLIRAITASQAYQLSSVKALGPPDQLNPQLFAKMPVRPLSDEQLLGSLLLATGISPPSESERREFVAQFRRLDRRPEPETSVLQSLFRMNCPATARATDTAAHTMLGAVVSAPFLDMHDKIETLYLTTLSRYPTTDEATAMIAYVRGASAEAKGFADVVWVLLNCAEFSLNH